LTGPLTPEDQSVVIADFSRLAPEERFFPIEEFAELLAATTRRHRELWGYSSPSGLPALRAQIARRLAETGAPWNENDILVTSGAQQGLDLLFKTFVDPGDAVAVESPTYPGILPLLRFYGAEVVEIPVHRGRHDLSGLLGREIRLVYAMPEHQNPTGSTMDEESRRRFLAASLSAGAIVIEDGYERSTSGLAPLCAARKNRVVSLGSFSKDLVPGFRLGWIAADRPILRALSVAKQTTDLQTPLPLQAAMAEFLEKGRDREVLARRGEETEARREILTGSISERLPSLAFQAERGSPIVWLELPVGESGRQAARASALRGVRVAPGADFDPFGRDLPALRLSVSRVERSSISEGVARLAAALRSGESGSARAIPAL
jgi:DNA-binding transcriptional MocR family regulator